MRTWAKGTARATLLTASFVALGAGTTFPGAYADTTSGQSSVLGGNQANLPVSAPIDASGNALAAAGRSTAGSQGGASVQNGGGNGGGQQTNGTSSVGGGNQVNAPVSAPINACGNAVAIFGTADAGCKGGAKVKNGGSHGGGQQTSGKYGVGSGNQANAPISAPVNACGNAVAVFGSAEAGCKGGAKVFNGGDGSGQRTNGDSSVLGGNQVNAPVSAPVNICGNSAALFGKAVAACEGGAKVKNGGSHGGGQQTSGKYGVGSGNQVNAPVGAPVDLCGNAVGNAAADCEGGAEVVNGGGHGGQRTSGESGVLSGNQANVPVSIPVSVCGNAVAVLGEAGALCEGGAFVHGGSGSYGGGQQTSGKYGVGSGNQANAPISAPVNICGNAVAILGSAAAGCSGTAVVGGSTGNGSTTSGQYGAGSGNQANAPVEAPVDVCSNVAAVLGHVDPACGAESSHYGGVTTSTDSRVPGPVTNGGLLGLPELPATTKALPADPSAALPALPALPGKAPALPVQAPALPSAAQARTLPAQPSALPVETPALPDLNAPGLPAELPSLPADIPANIPAQVPAAPMAASRQAPAAGLPATLPLVGALPVAPAGLPANPAALPTDQVGLPGTPALPGPHHRTHTTPVPADLPALPVVSEAELPALPELPVTGALNPPQVGGPGQAVTKGAETAADQVGAVHGTLGKAAPMSADERLTASSSVHSLWVLGIAAVLTAVSGALAFSRRFRLSTR